MAAVRICSGKDDSTWLELQSDQGNSQALISRGNADPVIFAFHLEHVRGVISGLSYQAWNEDGYFLLRREGHQIRVEFQSQDESRPTRCSLEADAFASMLDQLVQGISMTQRCTML